MNHLGHKLPWNALNDALILFKYSDDKSKIITNAEGYKKITYIAECFVRCLKEFAETDKSSDKDLELHDPSKWDGGVLYGGQGHLGYIKSILSTYIQLNLLLLDFNKYEVITFGGYQQEQGNWPFVCCTGGYDGGHPDWIAEQFCEIYKWNRKNGKYEFVELNQENTHLINEYNKLLFKCLYIHVKNHANNEIDVEKIKNSIYWTYSLKYQ